MKDKWLKELHDRMSDFEMDAPENLWAEIEREDIYSSGQKRKSGMLWVKGLSAAVATVAVAILISNYILSPIQESPVLSNKSGLSDLQTDIETKIHQRQELSSDFAQEEHKSRRSRSEVTDILPEPDIKSTENQAEQEEHVVKDTLTKARSIPDFRSDRYYANLIATTSSKKDSRFSVSVYTSGGFNSNINQKTVGGLAVSAGSDNAGWKDSPQLGILLFNKGRETTTEIKHRQPIRTGVSFTYKLNERVGLGTGLSYTNLRSDMRNGSKSHYFTGEQSLHYVGVPLNISYDVLRWKRLRLYATAGMLAEKCVSGKVRKDYILDNIKSEIESENLHTKPFQFSVNASAGIQLNITDKLGFYGEPGLSYYFNDGTEIQTIYKDKPLNFNFNLGLRLTIGQ